MYANRGNLFSYTGALLTGLLKFEYFQTIHMMYFLFIIIISLSLILVTFIVKF